MAKAITTNPTELFIESPKKWVRVLAGPGAGKSYGLKNRVKHHVEHEGIAPERILVVTFTSVAAQDLRHDIIELSKKNPGLQLEKVQVSTLHALALKQLEKEVKSGRKMEDYEVDTMLRDLEPDIGKSREKKVLLRKCTSKADLSSLTDEEKAFEKSLKDWQKQHQGFTLEHPIPYMCEYLQNNESARKRLSFDRVLVDEYQDLNPDEQQYIELLTAKSGKLAVIGDDDQSIYAFKGASPEGIVNFASKHMPCEDIRFTVCRRCPSLIVDLANRLIQHNDYTGRIKKTFTAFPENQNGSVELLSAETPDEEISLLCDKIQAERMDTHLKTIVVLSPTKERGKKMYEELEKAGIPVEFCYRGFLLDSKTVCESISYLTLAADSSDRIAWRYLLGGVKTDRYAKSYQYIRDAAKKEKRDILEVLEECASGTRKISYTHVLIKRYQEVKAKLESVKVNPRELLSFLDKDEQQYANILERAILERYDTEGFSGVRRAVLEAVYSPEAAAATDRVRVMSLHAAKGLSAHLVIIMSAIDDLIPLGKKNIEEQRRLFYVAITRCKGEKAGDYPGKLVISAFTHSEDGTKIHSPSPFIQEMGLSFPS